MHKYHKNRQVQLITGQFEACSLFFNVSGSMTTSLQLTINKMPMCTIAPPLLPRCYAARHCSNNSLSQRWLSCLWMFIATMASATYFSNPGNPMSKHLSKPCCSKALIADSTAEYSIRTSPEAYVPSAGSHANALLWNACLFLVLPTNSQGFTHSSHAICTNRLLIWYFLRKFILNVS